MKLNHFICPNCGHDFYCDNGCTMCDACNSVVYASQSLTTNLFNKGWYLTGTSWKVGTMYVVEEN